METTKQKEKQEKKASDFIKTLEQTLGEGILQKLSGKQTNTEYFPTGIYSLDKILGGGLPKGRITELYGSEGSGKTTLALQILCNVQKISKLSRVVYIDSEFALNLDYCKKLGVDEDNFWLSQPSSAEDALEAIYQIANSNFSSFIVLDSIAALVPKSEIENDLGDVAVASLARILSSSLKRIISVISKSNTCLLFINQLRSNVTTFGFGPSDITAGGKALKYFSSLRLEITRLSAIRRGDKVIGTQIRAKTTKNKTFSPYKDTTLNMYFGDGFSQAGDIFNLAVEHDIITKDGMFYFFKTEKLGKGKEMAIDKIKNDFSLKEKINSEIIKVNK